jgi:hypothetical protein
MVNDMAATTKEWNKTELKKRGWTESLIRRLLPQARVEKRHSYKNGRYTTYLWNEDVILAAENRAEFLNVQAKRKERELKLDTHRPVDLLAAVFTVNRAAKRQRDLAQKHYRSRKHGLAASCKQKKDTYYLLKDAGIATAYHAGRLACVNIHANLYLYKGEG